MIFISRSSLLGLTCRKQFSHSRGKLNKKSQHWQQVFGSQLRDNLGCGAPFLVCLDLSPGSVPDSGFLQVRALGDTMR